MNRYDYLTDSSDFVVFPIVTGDIWVRRKDKGRIRIGEPYGYAPDIWRFENVSGPPEHRGGMCIGRESLESGIWYKETIPK